MNDNATSPTLRRVRRRNRQRPAIDNSVPSPCVQVCWFNEDSGYCDGCSRTAAEIRDWFTMNRDDKLALLETLTIRKVELTQT